MPGSFMNFIAALILWAGAFVLGSIPFGVLIASIQGKDLRAEGSGNIGATNAVRVLGRTWGLVVFALDLCKGLIPTWMAASWFEGQPGTICIAATCAVAGHVWSPFLGWRGGKGIATAFGALIAIMPLAALLSLVVWGVCLLFFRYVSVASLAATVSAGYWLGISTEYGGWYVLWALAMALLAFYTHRENLKRLMTGTELKVGS